MPNVSIYLNEELFLRAKAAYPNMSQAVQGAIKRDLDMVERKVHPADISFQLRMLAERVDRFVNGSSPSTALNGSSPSAALRSVKPGVGP